MASKKYIALFFIYLAFLQSFAGGLAIYCTNTSHAVESIADSIPTDSWGSEDGIENDGFKELFPAKNALEWDDLFEFSKKIYIGELPVQKLQIGFKNIQSPPPDAFSLG